MLHSKGVDAMRHSKGLLTNGGVWPSINGTLIWALALLDGERGWDEWKKNCLAYHAEAYPDIWYGIWSGPDSYNSILSPYPGQTQFAEKLITDEIKTKAPFRNLNWTDFPVMNMHPHAWTLYSAAKLLGVEFTPDGVVLTPTLPLDTYRFESALLGFVKTETGYHGWYAPQVAGNWSVTIRLPENDVSQLSILEINGEAQAVSNHIIQFSGHSEAGQPLRWSLK
jgi:hypothetical protein